jgi:exonuclease SbcC
VNTQPLHLTGLDIAGFRGIERPLGLDFGRRLTIVYGGNATGKSSIAQAIEFAISGQVRDQEDGLIPAGYLANTRVALPGSVSLVLDDGAVLRCETNWTRSEIEHQFRDVAAVDWPDRQPLPITTTHVTTQGMLARVLGASNAVTRNDLSGLCAGAYLRFLVQRAEKLSIHFRQASSGLNIQAELRDARATYDTAKLVLDSLLATSRVTDVSSRAVETKLRDLNALLDLAGSTTIDIALAHLGRQFEDVERKIRLLQSLLNRTRELGQHESESAELLKQLSEAETAERAMLKRRATQNAALATIMSRLKDSANQRDRLLDTVAAHERHQQSVSAIAALNERLRELRANQRRVIDDIQVLKNDLDAAHDELVARSTRLAQQRQSRLITDGQRNAIEQAIIRLGTLPAARDPDADIALDHITRELASVEQATTIVQRALENARKEEASIATRLSEISRVGERFIAAINEMRSFSADGHCPLCGHDHGTVDALEHAIEHASAAVLHGANALRRQYEIASKSRQDLEEQQLQVARRLTNMRATRATLLEGIKKRGEDRRIAVSTVEESLRRAGLTLSIETDALGRGQREIEARLATLDQEIRDASVSEREDEARRSQLERAFAAKMSEREQLERLTSELNDQVDTLKTTLGTEIALEDVATNKHALVEMDPLLKLLEHEQAQLQASLVELDRTLADKRAAIAGIERRLQVVTAFLNGLDAELQGVGATRDVRTILALEQQARHRRDEVAALKSKALEIQQEQRILDESRTLSTAHEQLRAAEQVLKAVQTRQQRQQIRSAQFKDLHHNLEELQHDTAEIVLENIRRPVSIVFQAMTAGCPWDIEFRLEDGKVNAVLTDGSASDVTATSVLNSAYVNVAAIALRLALASQQRWTRLRTVVLDDPILEMDHLTQSALIDGLEAVLTSAFAPWQDLQFVLTTWSEDFAVMAAHKLAHLNRNSSNEATGDGAALLEDFVIHRLSCDLDGTIVSQRHVPRWRREAHAA